MRGQLCLSVRLLLLQVAIPPDLWPRVAGRRELRHSLGTRDPQTAHQWAYRVASLITE
ncbi:MAG: DUF6538 domain-containing protein [Gammaproteobacteria bacterium]